MCHMGLRDTGRKLYTGTKSRVFSLCYDGVQLNEDSVKKLLTGLKAWLLYLWKSNVTATIRGQEHIILMRALHCDDSNLSSNRKNHSKQTEYNIGVVNNNNNNNNNNNRRKQQHIRSCSHFQDHCHSTLFHFNQLGLLHRHQDSSVSQHIDEVTTQREH